MVLLGVLVLFGLLVLFGALLRDIFGPSKEWRMIRIEGYCLAPLKGACRGYLFIAYTRAHGAYSVT